MTSLELVRYRLRETAKVSGQAVPILDVLRILVENQSAILGALRDLLLSLESAETRA